MAMQEIILRMQITRLEARLELRDIERTALSREISSPSTPEERRAEAIERRDAALTEWRQARAELELARRSYSPVN